MPMMTCSLSKFHERNIAGGLDHSPIFITETWPDVSADPPLSLTNTWSDVGADQLLSLTNTWPDVTGDPPLSLRNTWSNASADPQTLGLMSVLTHKHLA